MRVREIVARDVYFFENLFLRIFEVRKNMSFSTHPQNLTKDRLREDLLNNGIQLPSGNVMKRVLVDLYIRHLTPWHKDEVVEERSEFSDDEPLTPKKSPRVSLHSIFYHIP